MLEFILLLFPPLSVVDCSHIIAKSTEGERGFQMITLFVTIAVCKSDYGEGRGD